MWLWMNRMQPKQSTSSFAQEIWKNIMKEALPYLNIYPTEEIPDDMKAEVEAEQAAAAEAAASEEESSEEESAAGRRNGGGSADRRDSDRCRIRIVLIRVDDSVLGDAPVNENLENVEPADATEDTADANPTE